MGQGRRVGSSDWMLHTAVQVELRPEKSEANYLARWKDAARDRGRRPCVTAVSRTRRRARGLGSNNDVILELRLVEYAQYIDQIAIVLLHQVFGAWTNIPLAVPLLSALPRAPR